MIFNKWYAILESNEVKKNVPYKTKRIGENLVLWRNTSGEVSCTSDICLHRRASLGMGKVSGDNIKCPFHGIEYDNQGKCCLIPANGKNAKIPENYKIKNYHIKEEHGFIWLWWGEDNHEMINQAIPFFKDIDNTFSQSTIKKVWATHYSRVIENQLDVVHVPFVHYNTIGKGNKTLVNGPYSEYEGDSIKIWVHNEKDKGKPAKKHNELNKPEKNYNLHFIFPNIWQNRIADELRVIAVFSPIDNENTMLYLRVYQKIIKLPLLKGIMNKIFSAYNMKVAEQDRAIVVEQIPKRTSLKMEERLIAGDYPIILYRKRREELMSK